MRKAFIPACRGDRSPGARRHWPALPLAVLFLLPWPILAANPEIAGEARELLREAQRSRGGIAEMARVAEIRRQGVLVMATPEGEESVPLRVVIRPPGTLIFETGVGEELVRREFTDGKAWEVRGSGERQELSSADSVRLRRLISVDEAFLARSALAGDVEITGVDDGGLGQVPAELPAAGGRAVLLLGDADATYRLVVPPGGGLPLRVDYTVPGEEEGAEIAFSDVFARWRIVEGLLFPAEVILYRDTRAVSAVRYQTIEVEFATASPASPAVAQP